MPAQSEPYPSPAVHAFGNELAFWREEARHSKTELAELLGYTPQYVGQIEAYKNVPSPKFAEDVDTFFQTNGLFRRLWENIDETRDHVMLPPEFPEYVRREREATSLRVFCVNLVSGLFQTERYARTIVDSMGGPDVDDIVAERMERQTILTRELPPRVWLVLDEAVIRRSVGPPEVMREQLAHLLDTGERNGNVRIQIVPYGAGYYAGLTGSFTILGFKGRPDVAYTESSGEGKLLDRHDRVALQAVTWDLIQGHTRDVVESRALIKEAMENL